MSRRRAPLPSASDALTPDAALVERFRADLAALFPIDSGTLLVAVSGGGDSLALLLLARAALGERCVAATVDHGLRPASAAEAAMVAALCRARGISHVTLHGKFPDRAGRTANLSARARAMRYALLEGERVRRGATAIATAHHADDQLETMVMRLNRGAGVAGLAGVRAKGGRIVRPLLGWRRAELAAIVVACGIVPVDDPSNVDDRFDRARLRKVLAEVGAFDVSAWQRSAKALGDAEAALVFAADLLFQEHVERSPDEVGFTPEGIPFELQRRLCVQCLRHLDPTIEPRGDAILRLMVTLHEDGRGMLGDVLAVAERRVRDRPFWSFVRAPTRRGV